MKHLDRNRDILLRFGQKVRQIRIRKKMSQEELGFLSSLDRTYISGVELGKRNISLVNIERIARALDVPISDLLKIQ